LAFGSATAASRREKRKHDWNVEAVTRQGVALAAGFASNSVVVISKKLDGSTPGVARRRWSQQPLLLRRT